MTGESEFAHYERRFRCSRADSPTATPRIQALWCGTTPTVHIAGHAEVHGDFSQWYIERQDLRLRLSGDQRDAQAYRNSNRHRPDPPLRGRWRHDRRVVCLTHRPGRQTGRMSWAITVNPRRLQGNRAGRSCRERGRPRQHRTMRRNPSQGSDAVVRFLPSLLFAGPARFAPRHRAASAVHRGDCGPVVGAPHRGGASPPLPHR